MTTTEARRSAIQETIADVKACLSSGLSIDSLNDGKVHLMALAARKELFPRKAFPLPVGSATDRLFRVHQDPDGRYALYVNSGVTGQLSRPHDHGESWAIVAAVEGEERHYLFEHGATPGSLINKGELDVRPGTAISLLPGGIHQVEVLSSEPLMHLHLYGRAFERQTTRVEFDLETGDTIGFNIEDWDYIEDAH